MSLYTTLKWCCDYLEKQRDPQKVVYVGDGWDVTPGERRARVAAAIAKARGELK